jgi:organic hydroperoxide reductase OsmC/OhrA
MPHTTPPRGPAMSTRKPTMCTNGEATRTRENTWQRRDAAQRTPKSMQKTGSNPTEATTHPQTSLLASTHATCPTPQLRHTRTNATKVTPGGVSEEKEKREEENEVRKEKTERKLDWEEEVEHEYEQKTAPTPLTTPRDLSCLRTTAARLWRDLRCHACHPPNPWHTTAPHPTHSPPYSWTSY